jgi:hypothetical protein
MLGGGWAAASGYGAYTSAGIAVTVDMAGGAGGKVAENALARSNGQCVPLDKGVYSTALAAGGLSLLGSGAASKLSSFSRARNVSRLKASLQDARAQNLSRAGQSTFAKSVPVRAKPSKTTSMLAQGAASTTSSKVGTEAASKVTPNAGYSAVGGQCRGVDK